MKKNNILFLLLISFLLTGCTFNYDAKIMLDGSVEESVNDKTYVKEIYGKETVDEKVLENVTKQYLDVLDQKADDIVYKSDSVNVVVSNRYDNVEEYSEKSKAINQIFKELKVRKSKKSIKLESIESEYDFGISDYYGSTISISLPYKVIDHNADSIDESTNTYTWNVDSNFKGVKLEYNTKSFYTLNIIKLFNYATINTYIMIIVIIFIIAFVIVAIVYYYIALRGVRL